MQAAPQASHRTAARPLHLHIPIQRLLACMPGTATWHAWACAQQAQAGNNGTCTVPTITDLSVVNRWCFRDHGRSHLCLLVFCADVLKSRYFEAQDLKRSRPRGAQLSKRHLRWAHELHNQRGATRHGHRRTGRLCARVASPQQQKLSHLQHVQAACAREQRSRHGGRRVSNKAHPRADSAAWVCGGLWRACGADGPGALSSGGIYQVSGVLRDSSHRGAISY